MDPATDVIGFDVGATKIHAAAVSFSGKIIRQALAPTPRKKDAVIAKIVGMTEALGDAGTKPKAIGIAVPGPVDFEKQIVRELPNLSGWKNVPLAKIIEGKTGLPCIVDNDAKCFLQAELNAGAANGRRSAVGIIMGTGFGSALAIDGEIYRGAHGSAGEAGHMVISEAGGAPGFRNAGELESFASGKSISKRTGGIDAKAVFDLARKGNPKARKIVNETAYRAGVGISNIINLLDPEIIVVGGSLSDALPQMLPEIRKVIRRNCFYPENKIPIVRHKLECPGTVGAAFVALKAMEK